MKGDEGQVVLILGEPGIGKSRLTEMLHEHLGKDPCLRLRYQCSPHYTNSALARYGTASHLDKTARLYRQQYDHAGQLMADYHQPVLPPDNDSSNDGTDAERWDAENQGAMHNRHHRKLTTHWDEHGCLEIKARLTAEQGALVIKAIEAAIETIKERESCDASDTSETAEPAQMENAPAEWTDHNLKAEKFKAANEHATHHCSDALVLMARD